MKHSEQSTTQPRSWAFALGLLVQSLAWICAIGLAGVSPAAAQTSNIPGVQTFSPEAFITSNVDLSVVDPTSTGQCTSNWSGNEALPFVQSDLHVDAGSVTQFMRMTDVYSGSWQSQRPSGLAMLNVPCTISYSISGGPQQTATYDFTIPLVFCGYSTSADQQLLPTFTLCGSNYSGPNVTTACPNSNNTPVFNSTVPSSGFLEVQPDRSSSGNQAEEALFIFVPSTYNSGTNALSTPAVAVDVQPLYGTPFVPVPDYNCGGQSCEAYQESHQFMAPYLVRVQCNNLSAFSNG